LVLIENAIAISPRVNRRTPEIFSCVGRFAAWDRHPRFLSRRLDGSLEKMWRNSGRRRFRIGGADGDAEPGREAGEAFSGAEFGGAAILFRA